MLLLCYDDVSHFTDSYACGQRSSLRTSTYVRMATLDYCLVVRATRTCCVWPTGTSMLLQDSRISMDCSVVPHTTRKTVPEGCYPFLHVTKGVRVQQRSTQTQLKPKWDTLSTEYCDYTNATVESTVLTVVPGNSTEGEAQTEANNCP